MDATPSADPHVVYFNAYARSRRVHACAASLLYAHDPAAGVVITV